MKKIKVFTKGQIAVFLMVAALAGAVWLNIKYSGSQKYLGESKLVSGKTDSQNVVETSAKVKTKADDDYFANAVKQREAAYTEIEEAAEETLKGANITESEKEKALESVKIISNRIAAAQNIEALLKAKGFKEAVAVLTETTADIVVKSEGLETAQTMQIQDIVTAQTNVPLSAIKIVAVK